MTLKRVVGASFRVRAKRPADGLEHSLSSGADVELVIDATDMGADSAEADVEDVGDFFVNIALA